MRLIDADALIDYFYYGIDDKPIIDGISDRKIINIIKNHPTAYSVDKAVEDVRCRCYEMGLDESQTEIIVSEIVKVGVENEIDRCR